MAVYRLYLDVAEIKRIGLAEAQREATDMCRRVLNRGNVLTPVDTGNLRGHNQMRVQRQGLMAIGEVFNEAEYAKAVHDGTKAYTIRPKHKKALRFEINGEVVFATRVNMPARRGRPWLERALMEVARPAGYRIKKV